MFGHKPPPTDSLTKADLDAFRLEIREEMSSILAEATERLLRKAVEMAESEPSWAFRLANKADAAMEQAKHAQDDVNVLLGEVSVLSDAQSKIDQKIQAFAKALSP